MQKRIEIVYFDYGNVMSRPQDETLREDLYRLAAFGSVERETFWETYYSLRHDYDGDRVDAEDYWRNVLRRISADPDVIPLERIIEIDDLSWSRIHPGAVAWARAVKAAGFRIGILSNMPSRFFEKVLRPQPWLSIFDHLVISGEEGVCKPDPAIYRRAAEIAGVPPERILFFDDTLRNVEAAAAAGFDAHLFTSLEAAPREVLRSRGVPEPR